jgi:hypothetical protein
MIHIMTFLIIHGIGGYAGIHWQQWLHDELVKSGNKVLMPNFSDPDHPDRNIWLEEVKNEVKDIDLSDLVIIGHSLGATTALDFIEQSSVPIKGFISVSGFASDYGAELNGYFLRSKDIDFTKARNNIEHSSVIYGDNDPYVTQPALQEVSLGLKVSPLVIHRGGHLNSEAGYTKFPKLLEIVNSIN